MAQPTKLNPNWEADYKNYLSNVTAADIKKRDSIDTNLIKFTDEGNWLIRDTCTGPWVDCDPDRITEGIQYLLKVPSEPGEGPGPKKCGRVSCSWNVSTGSIC